MYFANPAGDTLSSTMNRYCTFWVGDQCYGLGVGAVREILKSQVTTPVPAASPVIFGLINLRGEIVTAIDLRRRLDLPERMDPGPSMSVVVSLDDEVISLIVDRVGEVLDLAPETIEPIPATVPQLVRDVTLGVYRLPSVLVQVLDASRLVLDEGNDR